MKFIAIGRVYPERADVRFSEYSQSNETSSIKLFCWASQLSIHVDDPRIDSLPSARLIAEHYGQTFLSALGLACGGGFVVEITQILNYEGGVDVLGVRDESLEHPDFVSVYEAAIKLGMKDVYLRFAMLDYTRAIHDIAGSAYSCFRAIESLATAIGGSNNKSSNWKSFHDALGTTKEEVDRLVKDHADPIRHGNWAELSDMTWEQRHLMLLYTRDVLIRYISYREGQQALIK
jgi:hypothetical protein